MANTSQKIMENDQNSQELRRCWLYRAGYGRKQETFEQLQAGAELAEQRIGYYGITVWAWTTPPQERTPRARMEAVQQTFEVVQTTVDPAHYTLVFHKPLTQEQVEIFNRLFAKRTS